MNKKDRSKRLGQYFTGTELAKILCEIALKINPTIKTAIDPMMGKGDMLIAVNQVLNSTKAYGIELDKQLEDQIRTQFTSKKEILFGNTFEKHTLDRLGRTQFDLVITNPPYVRHLNQKDECKLENFIAPSGSQIRNDLIYNIKENKSLSEYEKKFLIRISKSYSGLSDLSVPSIIQCAALTKNNGILALVIPESCITREYSLATLITLFKLFDVKTIIKDEGRQWFEDAQVKTLLLVCQKLKEPRNLLSTHPKISIIEVSNGNSRTPLGENIFLGDYGLFASFALKTSNQFSKINGFTQYFSSIDTYLIPLLAKKNSFQKYPELKCISEKNNKNRLSLDSRLVDIVDCDDFVKLDDLEININQGLRTGANSFFYYDFILETEGSSKVYFNLKNKSRVIDIPSKCLKTVLRKQNEISKGYFISRSTLKGRVLVLNNYYTSTDIRNFNLKGNNIIELPYKVVEHINYCETLNIGTGSSPKYFPELSAVRTNVSEKNGIRKSWYHLPALKNRHLPNICIPRVNSKLVKSFAVQENVVVDANFLTINITENSIISIYGLTAILNSDWIKIQLELKGNVLGGGALKLDRNHLTNLLIPSSLLALDKILESLGKELISSIEDTEILMKINQLINSTLQINDNNILKSFLEQRLKLRISNA